MKHLIRLSFVMLIVVGLLVGCGGAAEDAGDAGASAESAFKVTGMVDAEKAWTLAELEAMDTLEANYTNKDDETTTYTGVAISALLDAAGVGAGAAGITLVADDGYSADVTLEEIAGCADCIIGFRDDGGLMSVLPGFPGKVQVKGVIEMQVK